MAPSHTKRTNEALRLTPAHPRHSGVSRVCSLPRPLPTLHRLLAWACAGRRSHLLCLTLRTGAENPLHYRRAKRVFRCGVLGSTETPLPRFTPPGSSNSLPHLEHLKSHVAPPHDDPHWLIPLPNPALGRWLKHSQPTSPTQKGER